MADINNIKDTVLSKLGAVAGKTRGFAEKAADKAKDVARIAKLNIEISSEKDTIQKAYLEIGKLYYETHREAPEGFFLQLVDEITLANKNIADLLAELSDLKAGLGGKTADIEVQFTEPEPVKENADQEECCAKESSEKEDIPGDKTAE